MKPGLQGLLGVLVLLSGLYGVTHVGQVGAGSPLVALLFVPLGIWIIWRAIHPQISCPHCAKKIPTAANVCPYCRSRIHVDATIAP